MMPNCIGCGRFMKRSPGVSWAAIYDMIGMSLDREIMACAGCTTKYGPVTSNAKPADGDMRQYQGIFPPAPEETR